MRERDRIGVSFLLVCAWALSVACTSQAAGADGLATEKDYQIVTDGSTTKVKAGGQGSWSLKIVPHNGFKVSQDTPFNVSLTATPGLKFSTTRFARKDLVDPASKEPQLKTTFSASNKGAEKVKADLTFFLCTDKLCQRMSASHELLVSVE